MSTNLKPLFSCFLLLQLLLAAAIAAEPAGITIKGPAGEKQLTAAQLAALPRTKVTISDHGTSATYEGTELSNVLALLGAPAGEKIRGETLSKYVLVEAADKYRALFALPELDRAFADRTVILADQRDGKPLPEKEGPYRIVVEGEKRQARCVRQVIRISLETAK